MGDEVRLVIPAEPEFRPVAHLVAGGLALRADVTVAALDDLQLGLGTLLALRDDPDDLVLSLGLDGTILHAAVGPFPEGARQELEGEDGRLGSRRVLETVVDSFEIEERDGGAWVELTKQTAG